jgi:hypothetical protein
MSRGLQAEDPGLERMTPDPERSSAPLASEATPGAAGGAQEAGTLSYRVTLPMFEGPLDLLLHLVQKHELDILNIPIAFITEKYVEYIQLLDELNIDLASEYLVMAATLVHIKSRMLLPNAPDDDSADGSEDAEADPRAELVRRLLEYQKYKLGETCLDAAAAMKWPAARPHWRPSLASSCSTLSRACSSGPNTLANTRSTSSASR